MSAARLLAFSVLCAGSCVALLLSVGVGGWIAAYVAWVSGICAGVGVEMTFKELEKKR